MNTTQKYLLTLFFGFVAGYGIFFFTEDDSLSYDQITVLQNRVAELELDLAEKNGELMRIQGSGNNNSNIESVAVVTSKETHQDFSGEIDNASIPVAIKDNQQILKDLSTRNDFNPRTFSERINDFLSANPGKENAAFASKVVFDMADNRESLPDYELEAVYQKQTDPDLKRVAAQVLSLRGDNSLIDKQINEFQAGLQNGNADVRQKTLVELAKTRYAGAANTIAPLLKDKNIDVKLNALLALRATGNESHIHLVQDLVNYPDPSVSWLAKDVINNLQYLSERARMHVSTNDIVAELPPIITE